MIGYAEGPGRCQSTPGTSVENRAARLVVPREASVRAPDSHPTGSDPRRGRARDGLDQPRVAFRPSFGWLAPPAPDEVEVGQGRLGPVDALHECKRQRPQLEQRRPPRERLSDLPEQQKLRGAKEEKAPALAPIGEQFHGVEEARLLLHLIEDDEVRAVVQPANRIGGEAQALVGIVEREVDRAICCDAARFRVDFAAGLPGLSASDPAGPAEPGGASLGPGSVGGAGS